MKVGFIGLGVMGRPMALHLAQAGHALHVWARRPHSTVGLPAQVHATPAALGAACEVVFTMVTSSVDVQAVVLGEEGLVQGLAADSIVVDCSWAGNLCAMAQRGARETKPISRWPT